MANYKVVYPSDDPSTTFSTPEIVPDLTGGTTSWRDAKKALRSWYLEQAASLRSVSEKDYFDK